MKEALLESRLALPDCRPNPPVGCVIVKDGRIIARGHTLAPGEFHAEAAALHAIRHMDVTGCALFATLEPCSFFGRTPSCAKAIVASPKISSVYVGILDPHHRNRGKGLEIIREAGIPVEIGVLEEEIRPFLNPYLLGDE